MPMRSKPMPASIMRFVVGKRRTPSAVRVVGPGGVEDLSLSVPDEVRVAGFDDVKYASLLPVPLTTIHQPCAQLGASAVRLMIERLKNPDMPARDVILNFTLIVRASTGGSKTQASMPAAVKH